MEEKLKYRLVGAAVILALMAFFLPLILDSKKYKTEIVSQIPDMPQANQEQALPIEDKPKSEPLVIELDKKPKVTKESTKPTEPVITDEAKGASEDKVESIADSDKTQDLEFVADKASTDAKQVETETKEKIEKPVETTQAVVEPKVVDAQAADSQAPKFKEVAYVIQIGSFSNKDNATKLVQELRKQDYRAYQRVSKDFARVYVGPYPEKAIAESRSSNLAKIVGNSVKVLEFDPIKH